MQVKCDESPNGCGNCARLHLRCSKTIQVAERRHPRSLPSPTPSRGPGTYRACHECRTARTKCSGERPACASCREAHRQCSFEHHTERLPAAPLPGASGSRTASVMPERLPPPSVDSTTLSWLYQSELLQPKQIRILLTHYFQNFHTLRCFAFVHKPSFLHKFDEQLTAGTHKTALIHVMCSIGAVFYALDYSEASCQLTPKQILLAGNQWATTARSLLFESIDKISVENLMTAQLLYDGALRMANFAQAFMLSALMARMAQALQINLEYSSDILAQSDEDGLTLTSRECRRRLMWSCYVTDALCGSGVDQLTLIDDKDLKIQLPCDEQAFIHQWPCITQMLSGSPLPFIPSDLIPVHSSKETSLAAYFVQHVKLRKRVLKYIKHLGQASLPWLPGSEFSQLDHELRTWHAALPPDVQFTSSAIYIRKEFNQEGALALLHCAYHQTLCDLYRIGAPNLYKLRSAFYFPPEQSHFLKHLQWSLFKAATSLAAILAEGGRHSPAMIADTWLPSITYDSNRIMLYYLTTIFDPNDQSTKDLVLNTVPYLQSNVQALKTMRRTNAIAEGMVHVPHTHSNLSQRVPQYHAAESMLERLGVASSNIHPLPNLVLDDPYLAFGSGRSSAPGKPPQTAPDYVLNPLSIFRMARNDIPERHAPEKTRTTPSGVGSTASTGPLSASPALAHPPDLDAHAAQYLGPGLDPFFAPNLTWNWHPTETAVGSGMDSDGLLPWVGSSLVDQMTFMPPE